MALSPSLSVSINNDRTILTVTDTTNYGAPNEERTDFIVFLNAYKTDIDVERTAVVMTSNTGDPATVVSWTGPYSAGSDGWNQFAFVAIKAYSAVTSYSIYDAVFGPGNIVYRSKINSNIGNDLGNTTYWEVISDPATLAFNEGELNESINITSLVYNRLFSYNSQWKYGNAIASNCACTDCDEPNLIYPYEILSMWVNGLILADQRSLWVKGETIARAIQAYTVGDCGC